MVPRSGLLDDEPETSKATFESGYRAGAEEIRTRQPKVTDDRTAAPDQLRGLIGTDYGNAQRLVRRHGQNLRYCYGFNQWLGWCGTHWSFDPAVAERMAKDTVLSIYADVPALAKAEDREALHRHAVISEQASRIAAMQAEQRHLEETAPLEARIQDLKEQIWAAERARTELWNSCEDEALTARLNEVIARTAEPNRQAGALRDEINRHRNLAEANREHTDRLVSDSRSDDLRRRAD